MMMRFALTSVVALAAFVTGCAMSSPNEDFRNVEHAVSDRSGYRVHWNRGSPADADVAASVRQLLTQPLSSDSAVQVALLNNPTLQATYEDVGVAQADLVGAGLLKNPVFNATVLIPEGGAGATKLDLAVTANFIDLFQIPLRKRLARTALQSAELRTADAVLALAAGVREAHAEAVAARQRLDLRQTVHEAAAAAAEVAQRLHDAGNITDLDLANEQALAETAQLELTSAQAEAATARQRLGMLMGVVDDTWALPQRLPDAASEHFTTRDLEAMSLQRRLDFRAAEQNVLNAAYALNGSKKFGSIDALEAGASAEREHDGEWSIGPNLALPIPLFDQGQSRIARARSELRRSRAQRDALERSARAEVRTAAAQLAAAGDRATRLRDVVLPLRRRIVEQTQLQYNAMHVGIFELLRAKQDEVRAGSDYVDALRDYWVARAKLERAAGGALPAGIATTQPTTQPAPTSAPATPNPHAGHHH